MRLRLFTYGLLMFPEVLRDLTGREFSLTPATLPGYARYALKTRGWAPVPAIIEKPQSYVSGMLLQQVDQDAMNLFDSFENVDDGLYKRQTVTVTLATEKTCMAYAYIAGAAARRWIDGPWDAEEFKDRYLDIYRQKVIPKFLRGPG